jgi:hypothetical protein
MDNRCVRKPEQGLTLLWTHPHLSRNLINGG